MPPTGRPRAHHRADQVSRFPGVRMQIKTRTFSVDVEMSLASTAVSGLSSNAHLPSRWQWSS